MQVSAIIITKNAGTMIRRCLESVAWADETIVVDSGSTDDTAEICRALGVKLVVTDDWPGFGAQKNRALDAATGDWVFSIDADEWVTPELRDEMRAVIADPAAAQAYAMPRRSSFCGREMKHSGWWPDYVVRLFRRGAARFSEDLAHERLVVTGTTLKLKQPLMHEAISTMEQMLGKMNLYSSASARMLHARGRQASIGTAVLHGCWAFFRTYVLRRGFLDGREGFILAVANAEGSYYRYIKLLLENGKRR
ncbi:MAG: glycosyltransferase family 2 protein [Burkholderiales bacterium]|nr:glycosyltransferase family 2 protein [Burkholderiales bacterium]